MQKVKELFLYIMPISEQSILILSVISLIFGLTGTIIAIIANLKLKKNQQNIQTMFAGKEVADLESLILAHSSEILAIDKEIQELFEISNQIHTLALKSIHKVGVVRFNPFKDIGGDQSFAIALLDGKNSGLVISSLHTREGTRIYSKPILKEDSEKYTLTEEEKAAIKSAVTIKPVKL